MSNHRLKMTNEQRLRFDLISYERKKQNNIGKNFEYWNETHDKMLDEGWKLLDGFKTDDTATVSLELAKANVEEIRNLNCFARIVCGYIKNRQKIKMYSVIYKSKL